jgi:hypothetical protein
MIMSSNPSRGDENPIKGVGVVSGQKTGDPGVAFSDRLRIGLCRLDQGPVSAAELRTVVKPPEKHESVE